MKMPIFRSTSAAMIAVAAFILCHSAHASTRSTAGTPWEALQEQLDAGGVVTLTNDVTAADGDAMLTVTNTVTLDLNGHTIAFNGSKEVFHVGTGGDLTLTNGLAAGAVTGGGDHGVYSARLRCRAARSRTTPFTTETKLAAACSWSRTARSR